MNIERILTESQSSLAPTGSSDGSDDVKTPGFWRRVGGWGGSSRQVLPAMVVLAAIAALSTTISAGKDSVVAWAFGTRDAFDAYVIAFLIPMFGMNTVTGNLCASLTPGYIRVRDIEGKEASRDLLSKALFWSLGLLAVLMGVLWMVAPLAIDNLAGHFATSKRMLTVRLAMILIPCLGLNGIALLAEAILNAEGEFILPALAPVVNYLVLIVFFVPLMPRLGIYALAWATVAGFAAECGLTLGALYRKNLLVPPRFAVMSPAIRNIVGEASYLIGGSAIVSLSPLVDQFFATTLDPGSVSALRYGNKIPTALMGIAGTSVGSVLLPHFSRLLAANHWAELKVMTYRYLLLVAGLSVTATLLLWQFSLPLSRVIFERGVFTQFDSSRVARVQAMYALQIPFVAMSIIVTRVITASRNNWFITLVFLMSAILNLVLDLWWMRRWHDAGIALATSVTSMVVFLCYLAFVLHLLRRQIAVANGANAWKDVHA